MFIEFGYPNMRILYQLIRFVNTKISEGIPKSASQPTQLKPVILPPTLHLWAIILLVIVSANFAEAQRNSTSVSDTLSSKADERFARVLEPMTFQFPRDHGAHPEYQIEWWYYTGNLHTDDGKAFGYQLTFFRFALTPQMPERTSHFATNQVYMAHFAVTDAAKTSISALSVGVGVREDWRERREIQPTKSGWRIGLLQKQSRGDAPTCPFNLRFY